MNKDQKQLRTLDPKKRIEDQKMSNEDLGFQFSSFSVLGFRGFRVLQVLGIRV